MSVQTTARIWDSLLEEGTKILYRVSLALLKLYESDLLAIDNAGDLINHLRQCTQQIHDQDRLMKVRAHNITCLVSMFYKHWRQGCRGGPDACNVF